MTEAEKLLWRELRNRRLKGFKFRRQHPISHFIADFFCHEARLIIEVDGGIHGIEDQKEYDFMRSNEIEQLGIKVIRFTNEEIEQDIKRVLERIEETLQFTSPPQSPSPSGEDD